jgi:hypothetical protein
MTGCSGAARHGRRCRRLGHHGLDVDDTRGRGGCRGADRPGAHPASPLHSGSGTPGRASCWVVHHPPPPPRPPWKGPLATARPVMVLVVVFPVRICDGQQSLLGDLTRI